MDFNVGGDVLEAEAPLIRVFGFGIIVGEVVGLNCGGGRDKVVKRCWKEPS